MARFDVQSAASPATEITAVMEMSLDITVRKQLEERIQESEAKYRVIFDNIPNPVFVLDVTTLQIVDCNQSVTAVYGFSIEEMIGPRTRAILAPNLIGNAPDWDAIRAIADRHGSHLQTERTGIDALRLTLEFERLES